MKLIEIIELIRNLCNQHPDINSFHTGLAYEQNKDYIQYPGVFINFPYRMIIPNNSPNEQIEYELKLRLLVNSVDNPDAIAPIAFQTNYFNQDPTSNEIVEPIVDETKMRERALQLLNHLVEGLRLKEKCSPWYELLRGDIVSVERANNDVVTGVGITLRFRVANEYICEAQSIFNSRCGDFTRPAAIVIPDDILPPPPIVTRYSMQFDGINESLISPNSSVFDIETTQRFSVASWVRPVANPTTRLIPLSKWRQISSGQNGWFVMVEPDGRARFQLRSGAGVQTNSVIDARTTNLVTPNEWTHVVCTYDGSRVQAGVRIYINGVQSPLTYTQGNAITAGSMLNNADVTIGTIPTLNLFSEGDINSVNLWTKTLTQAEIDAEMLLLGAATTNTTDLMMENRMGDLATFDGTNWSFPDTLGQSVGFTSVNMDLTNRITSIPI